MNYEGIVIRPPSEANSLILQVTHGCSHNRCTFCATYKGRRFRIKDLETIQREITELKWLAPHVRRVFLCDGDALVIPQNKLVRILDAINLHFPGLERIGTYANTKSVLLKSPEDLIELQKRKLRIVYLGVESGDEEVLRRVRKGADRQKMIEAARRVKQARITLSVTVLLGIGGILGSRKHALETASLLTEMDPQYVGALTLMVIPGTPLYEEMQRGEFTMPDPFQLIEELGLMIAHSRFTRCYFTSNHASNYLPLRVHLPQQREQALRLIQQVLDKRDKGLLRPESMRAL